MKIFLDDERIPIHWVGYDKNWTVVKNHTEFIELVSNCINNNISIDIISFDNDLGDGQLEGYDCAKWLTNEGIVIPEVWVHTMNAPAKQNIYYIMKNWQNFNKIDINVKIINLTLK